ncbi:MAG: YidC/Oxa1 family membrane protein insertase [Ruminococcaceae bacterium]|nr:YidC/Oxa1 family membrane protein insertase [Oscillospiraceae bacterium]
MDIIKVPIGYLLDWIYGFVNNYGVALILFTLAVKLILLPLTLKQQKSMTKMQKLQPKLQALQEKYKNDQQMLSQETMKLYKEYGASPMGGCLPLLIQLPILISLYRVIYEPLKYMCHYSADKIAALAKAADISLKGNAMAQINIAQKLGEINFDFFGLNLAQKPSFDLWVTLSIPVLAAVTTYLSSKITQWMNRKPEEKKDEPKKPQRVLSTEPKKNAQNNAPSTEGMTKSMSVIMPIFTLWITWTLPMAMGVYWIASNVFGIIQTALLNNFYANKFSEEIEIYDSEKKARQSEIHPNKKKRRN